MTLDNVLAAGKWNTNAALLADCARLGYVKGDTLDPTYGEGNWWTPGPWEPAVAELGVLDLHVTTCDLFKYGGGVLKMDYRDLHYGDNQFDSVVFDPPYVSKGGRTTSGIPEFDERYGIGTVDGPKTPADLWAYNQLGFWECVRVLKPGGYLCMKSKDYISSGQLQPVTHWILRDALDGPTGKVYSVRYVDRLEHVGAEPQQPDDDRKQRHARRNLSTMLVFKKTGRRRLP